MTTAEQSPISIDEVEQALVRDFLGPKPGFFVEVGANHPQQGSQSWHLEQRDWRGVLVEPLPQLTEELRRTRKAQVFCAACSAPTNAGQRMPFYVDGKMSALDRDRMAPGSRPAVVIEVPIRTLDDILDEAGAPKPIDFLSIDVEGHEIEVLRGIDLARWQPRLILVEDHVADLSRHRFVTAKGYRLVRRTGFNGWYVPSGAAVDFGLIDRWRVMRKYYLALPVRMLRNRSRALRQPIKDWLRSRRDPR
jgi:FkbM family methyltransferase